MGFNKADDAGIYRLDDKRALVQTVDFFPPIVDDPYFFGQIAAANALSDIYAMGGRPLTALNIVGFPDTKMPRQVFSDILKGGADKIEEAGAVIMGGHSIKDNELKYGLAVTGIIDPARIVTNSGAGEGDRVFLTKALGTGIIATGIKKQAVPDDLAELTIKQMAALNKTAAELMIQHNVNAATDVSGYGLFGHAYEMASASGVSIELFGSKIPLLPEALRMAGEGMNPGGAFANRDYIEKHVRFAPDVDANLTQVMFDPQTSGGLLVAIPADSAAGFSAALKEHGLLHEEIGQIVSRQETALIIRK